jgi:hypothetical protein
MKRRRPLPPQAPNDLDGAVVADTVVTVPDTPRPRRVHLWLLRTPAGWLLQSCDDEGEDGPRRPGDHATPATAAFAAREVTLLEQGVCARFGRRAWDELLDASYDPSLFRAWIRSMIQRGMLLRNVDLSP